MLNYWAKWCNVEVLKSWNGWHVEMLEYWECWKLWDVDKLKVSLLLERWDGFTFCPKFDNEDWGYRIVTFSSKIWGREMVPEYFNFFGTSIPWRWVVIYIYYIIMYIFPNCLLQKSMTRRGGYRVCSICIVKIYDEEVAIYNLPYCWNVEKAWAP